MFIEIGITTQKNFTNEIMYKFTRIYYSEEKFFFNFTKIGFKPYSQNLSRTSTRLRNYYRL